MGKSPTSIHFLDLCNICIIFGGFWCYVINWRWINLITLIGDDIKTENNYIALVRGPNNYGCPGHFQLKKPYSNSLKLKNMNSSMYKPFRHWKLEESKKGFSIVNKPADF